MDLNKAQQQIPEIIKGILTYNDEFHAHILEKYFRPDAIFSNPLLSTQGVANIRQVFRVWTMVNKDAPSFKSTVFDGTSAVIHSQQNFRPRIFPLLHLHVPAITTLRFEKNEENGLYYVVSQEDSWTVDGLIQSVPLVHWWYNEVLRVILGRVISATGNFLLSAQHTGQQASTRAAELQQLARQTVNEQWAQIQARGKEYTELLQEYYRSSQASRTEKESEVAQANEKTGGN
ncbi:uncharacterized protein VTP21DRAFT_6146 [Calcarisporiella thermophila]|uniref:uncharacterized protein n=1 Tax=Calcarisporiella thermophila TaxID=911321 RepID=UPI003743626A